MYDFIYLTNKSMNYIAQPFMYESETMDVTFSTHAISLSEFRGPS